MSVAKASVRQRPEQTKDVVSNTATAADTTAEIKPQDSKVQDPLLRDATVSKVALIADLRELYSKYGAVTRDVYRGAGKYPEIEWRRHFACFGEFREAAGLKGAPPAVRTPSQNPSAGPEPVETDTVAGDLRSITLVKTQIHTLDALLEHCKVDLALWQVERFTVNKWEMGAVLDSADAQGTKTQSIATENLFQVKATLRKRADMEAALKEIGELKERAKKEAGRPAVEVGCIVPKLTGNMLEVNVPDSHFGKQAWSKETGWENYDTQIAEATFHRALETLLERSKHYEFEQILFVVGNDLLNSDDLEGRTTKGTFVSTDGRYQKTFATVRRTITKSIERLRQIAPVKVVMVSGNHDDLSVWHLGDSLECYFTNYPDVEIDNAPTSRKYHRFGNVLLMLTHGDKGKRTDYPLLMASERSKDFGETLYREAHTGHTHMTKLDEQHGVRVRVLPALCPPDAWHAENGFVGNQRNAEAYIWNKDEGLIAQVFHNDNAFPPIVTRRSVV